MHPNKTNKDLTRISRRQVGWRGGGEKARKHRHSLSSTSDNPRTILSVETPTLRPEFHVIDTGQEHRVRILCSKTTHHLQSVIPTAIRTRNQQSRQINTTDEDGDAGTMRRRNGVLNGLLCQWKCIYL